MSTPWTGSLRLLCTALAAVAVALFLLPIVSLGAQAPWARVPALLADPNVRDALRLSLISSGGAVALAGVLGLPLALWLAHGDGALRTAVRLIVTLPVVLPPIVAGIALLSAFGRRGLLGARLELAFGWSLPFTTAATVVAAAYMGLPFFVLAVESGLRALDPRWTAVAATLGAGPWRRLGTVTLPLLAPSLRTGALLCWARALGEFCATQMFAGNLAGTTRTLPLACAVAMESDPALAIALSLLLALLSIAVLAVLRHGLVLRR